MYVCAYIGFVVFLFLWNESKAVKNDTVHP